MKEKELQHLITDLLNTFGWIHTHFRPAIRQSGGWSTPITGHAGYPDITAVKDGQILFIELKSEKGRVRPEQQTWIDHLCINPHVEVYVLRPRDIDGITARLAGDRSALAHRRIRQLS